MGKPKDPYAKAARRDWRVASRPEYQAIKRTRRQTKQDAKQAQHRVSQVWSAFADQLGQIPGQYASETAGIAPALQSSIGALGSMLGTDLGAVPDAERAAGTANIGTIGAGALEQLSSQQQNMADYLASAGTQGAAQAVTTKSQYLTDLQNALKDLSSQRLDVARQAPDFITQRMDELKQQALAQALANKQLGIDQGKLGLAQQQFNLDRANSRHDNALQDAFMQWAEKHKKWLKEHAAGMFGLGGS